MTKRTVAEIEAAHSEAEKKAAEKREPGPFEAMQAVARWEIKSAHARLDVKRGKSAAEAFAIWRDHCGHSQELAESLVRDGAVVLRDNDEGKEYAGGKLARLVGLGGDGAGSTPDAPDAETVVRPPAI